MRFWIPESVTADPGLVPDPGLSSARILPSLLRQPGGVFGVGMTALIVTIAVLAPLLAPVDPYAVAGPSLAPPSFRHPLGTDALGRDLLSAVIYGARTSVLVAAAVGALAFVIGVTVGTVSGYVGGWIDDGLMRTTEFFQVVPRFFLAIIAIALFGPGLDRVVLVLGLTSWPLLARVVRAEVLTLRTHEFVQAAVALGAPTSRILVREMLPNALPAALVVLGLLLGQVLLIEASLAFIGVGDPNAVSWGALAGQAHPYLRVAWWLPLFPGLALTLAVLGFNRLADALARVLGGGR